MQKKKMFLLILALFSADFLGFPGWQAADAAFTLITFDVDGTLVRGGGKDGKACSAEEGAHARAFGVACGRVLGNGDPTTPAPLALASHEFHGSTDGLILLRLARATLGVEPSESFPRLDELMDEMYEFISGMSDEEVGMGIDVLPGVLETLSTLASMKDRVACGLVTGNVEGIARRKMRAVGVWQTGALAPPSAEQLGRRSWPGADDLGFLGGFGSDYCSGDVDDGARNPLDRGEQIAIAARRCQESLLDGPEEGGTSGGERRQLRRVVHVGDAPADVLAAKSFAEDGAGDGVCVGMVGVATGRYEAKDLRELAGEPIPGRWEPVVLEEGIADPGFLAACGVV